MTSRKIGKNRQDKFYYMAKEEGYRARSAYKLIQINKRFNFLKDIKSAIDLCGAPGSWSQVILRQYENRRKDDLKIALVDLDKIAPLPGLVALQGDIMSSEIENQLNSIFPQRVDLIMNDGAPNVGTEWTRDAFIQNELVLGSLKLTRKFLRPGGIFLTKIFRSKYYFKILFVLNKLFTEIKPVKPLSSRDESAETFLYCTGFKTVDIPDEFFDPKIILRDEEEQVEEGRTSIKVSEWVDLNNQMMREVFTKYECVENNMRNIFTDYENEVLKDLRQISEADQKKILKKLQRNRKKETYIKKTEEIIFDEDQRAINKIKRELKKIKKNEQKAEEYEKLQKAKLKEGFFADSIFTDSHLENKIYKEEREVVEEPSSDEESYSLSEGEKRLAVEFQENPEEYVEQTIGRYNNLGEEILPDFIQEDEDIYYKRQSVKYQPVNKREEYKNRKERRAEKFSHKEVEEQSEEVVHKIKMKRKPRKRIVEVARKGKIITGRKNLHMVDRRMKKDYRNKKK